ncbi:hypothetical protein N7530_007221 [Penicillium desertorum]|uniref:Uncharacterized protein n=1 Tax=Penicillium desertorum TaxID=1303715 RepID=A0A9W9WLS1_9EURO|nr:hypothetical protein N7530_007221 [Penicillium desertorum]
MLGKLAVEKCVQGNSFNIQDNKAGLFESDAALSTAGGRIVIQGAENDTAVYINFAQTLAPCFIGGCDPGLIRAFFTNYLRKVHGTK